MDVAQVPWSASGAWVELRNAVKSFLCLSIEATPCCKATSAVPLGFAIHTIAKHCSYFPVLEMARTRSSTALRTSEPPESMRRSVNSGQDLFRGLAHVR
jgi:hypothetical protein